MTPASQQQEPRTPDPRGRKHTATPRQTYPAATMRRARALAAAGFTPTRIVAILASEGHPKPARTTVCRWTNARYMENQLRDVRRARERAKRRRLLTIAVEMRERGVSYNAISYVFERYEDTMMQPDTVRHWMRMSGVPTDQSRRYGVTA